jgi:hypothetical protein
MSSSGGNVTVYSFFIVNKSGGLVFHRDFASPQRRAPPLDTNETLRLGSIWHSLHAISAQLSPDAQGGGIHAMRADRFALQCLQAATGTKFFLLANPDAAEGALSAVLRRVYELYADLVLKNPFYELEMPIRVELFDEATNQLAANPAAALRR